MANPLVSLRIPAKLNNELEKYAKLMDRTKTWLIRKGIENYLEELEDIEIATERLNDPNAEYISLDEVKKKLNLD